MTDERRRGGREAVAFRFQMPIAIRFRDLDALGHVNNAVYFTYLEMARTAYLAAVLERTLTLEDFTLVVAEANCRYRSPALYGERLHIAVAMVTLRSRSFTLHYRITDEESGRLVAEAATVQVLIDAQTRRPITIDPAFRRAVERLEGRTMERGDGR